jgi:Ner family transcriptional regulator
MKQLDIAKKASHEDWHPADIVAAMRKAGWSFRRLSKHYGLNPVTLSKVLRMPYPNGERLVAAAIGVKPEEIWPTRYGNDAKPNRGRRLRGFKKVNTTEILCNVKVNGGA